MPAKNIVVGQKVDPVKIQRAKELRRNMTTEEIALWHRLRSNQMGGFHFRRQQVIDGFIVDFYCHAAVLGIEVDGEVHQQQADYDDQRDQVLTARGLRVLRFTNAEIRQHIEPVLARILAACVGEA